MATRCSTLLLFALLIWWIPTSDAGQCPPGQVSDTGNTPCRRCPNEQIPNEDMTKCVKYPCQAGYYSDSGFMPCEKCAQGMVSLNQTHSTGCRKSTKKQTFDGPGTYVTTCQQNNDAQHTCVGTYTFTNDERDDCSYCTGSLMGQTRSYCLSAGTTKTYEAQFKSRGGTVDCTLNAEPACEPTCGAGLVCYNGECHDESVCPVDTYSITGKAPNCVQCATGKSTAQKVGQSECHTSAGGGGSSQFADLEFVDNCQKHNDDKKKCEESYTKIENEEEACTYCVGDLMGQKRKYCLNAGNTLYYENQFKSRGGTMTCDVISRSNTSTGADPNAVTEDCKSNEKKNIAGVCEPKIACQEGYYGNNKDGYQPCSKCPEGKTMQKGGEGGKKACFDKKIKCEELNEGWNIEEDACVPCQAGKHTDIYNREAGCVQCNGNYISKEGDNCVECPPLEGANLQKTKCTPGKMKQLPGHLAGMNYTSRCEAATDNSKEEYAKCVTSYELTKDDQVNMCTWCAAIDVGSDIIKDAICIPETGDKGVDDMIAYYKRDYEGAVKLNCTLWPGETVHRHIPGISPTPGPTSMPTLNRNSTQSNQDPSSSDSQGPDVGLIVGMTFGAIFVVIAFLGFRYWWFTQKYPWAFLMGEKGGVKETSDAGKAGLASEEGEEKQYGDEEGGGGNGGLRPSASARFSSHAMMADNPMLQQIMDFEEQEGTGNSQKRGSSTPDFASHYGTEADEASEFVYGHNPLAGMRHGSITQWRDSRRGSALGAGGVQIVSLEHAAMPTSVSYEQSVRTSITSIDLNPEAQKTLEEIESDLGLYDAPS